MLSIRGFFMHRHCAVACRAIATMVVASSIACAHGPGDTHGVPTDGQVGAAVAGDGMSATKAVSTRAASLASHGGQIAATAGHSFEVVYLPRETRIYVYAANGAPIAAEQAQGEAIMQVKGNPQSLRIPLEYTAEERGTGYLSAGADVSRVPDGQMQVTFDISGLSSPEEPRVQFTQTFALTKLPSPEIKVGDARQADAFAVARQGTCPVSGQRLGEHGTPLKLTLNDEMLFVCCRGCVDAVVAEPRSYFRSAGPVAPSAAPAGEARQSGRRIELAEVTAADEAAIRTQAVCPVMNVRLGAHGKPIKLLVDGQPLFLCCKGCVYKVQKTPDIYLSKVYGTRPNASAPQ